MNAVIPLAIVLGLVATPALSQPFEAFERFCLDTGGAQQEATARAQSEGWRVIGSPPTPGVQVSLLAAPPRNDGVMIDRLMVGFIADPSGAPLEYCSVMGAATHDDLVAAMNEWSGFSAHDTREGSPAWMFTRTGSGVIARPDLVDAGPAELDAAARTSGVVYGVGVRTARDGPFLFHFRVVSQ